MSNEQDNAYLRTPRRGLWGCWCRLTERLCGRPVLAVHVRDEPQILYPGMSRKEIRHVAAAICRAARKNAK